MDDKRTRFRRLKYKIRHEYFTIENVILVVAVILCLSWTYSAIEAMTKNWELTERLKTEQKNLELKKLEVEMSELENEYYLTKEYQELAARKLAGKQLLDEKMVYMPENTEEAKNKHAEEETVSAVPETEQKEYSNFEMWIRYLWR